MIRVKCLYTVYICTLNHKFNLNLPLFIAPMMDLVSYQILKKKKAVQSEFEHFTENRFYTKS